MQILSKTEEEKKILTPLVDEIMFLENQLIKLRKLPFYETKKDNPFKQRTLPAAKLYKELLQQYTNCVKVLGRTTNSDMTNEESPLRQWIRKRVEL